MHDLKKILVIDDDETSRLVARVLLERRNCLVVEAESGAQAIDLVKDEPFDLVLMDLSMPGMDGFETTRRIRDDNVHPKLPIVALTADTSKRVPALFLEAGVNAVLHKPLNSEHLDRLMSLLDTNIMALDGQ